MHLKVLILCGFLIFATSSSQRFDDEENSNFVMIGNSKDPYKAGQDAEDKTFRHGFYPGYPVVVHKPPGNEYHGGGFGYQGPAIPANPQPSSLISANINLLEPFMLVTFLLFVLSLIDKSRLPVLSRNDYIQEIPLRPTPSIENFLKVLANRTQNVSY